MHSEDDTPRIALQSLLAEFPEIQSLETLKSLIELRAQRGALAESSFERGLLRWLEEHPEIRSLDDLRRAGGQERGG